MKSLLLAALIFFLLPVAQTTAVQRSGVDLLVDCNNLIKTETLEQVAPDRVLGMGYCIGLIDGMITFNYVYEAVLKASENEDFIQLCLPDRISTRKLAELIVNYLEEHPDRLPESGQALAAQALVKAYPCPANEEP